jgi:hypothetical protein
VMVVVPAVAVKASMDEMSPHAVFVLSCLLSHGSSSSKSYTQFPAFALGQVMIITLQQIFLRHPGE